MKGAIAYGLVLRVNSNFANREIIVTTAVTLIIATTIIFGSTSGFMARVLLNKQDENQTAPKGVKEPLLIVTGKDTKKKQKQNAE